MQASQIERRRMLSLLGVGVLATRVDAVQEALQTLSGSPSTYKLAFFSAEQDKLIDRVSDMILPPDERSGGAHAARVSAYIDLIVANSPAAVRSRWKAWLPAFEAYAVAAKGKPFLQLAAADQAAILDALAPGLRSPRQPAEEFFAAARRLTIAGYYTSRIGLIDELGYKGNQVLASYPGCPHPPGSHGG
jgi:hypothetical protein